MSNNGWRMATFTVALIAVGVGFYGFQERRAVNDLTVRLAAVTVEAKQAHDETLSLSAQLAAAMADAKQAHSDAAASEAQATTDEQHLQTQLAAEARPDLPVSVQFRKALLGPGLVGVFRNDSGKTLEFTLDLQSDVTGHHVRRAVVLNPNQFIEIGAKQGWPFAPGQRITLENPAYRTVARTVGS